MDRLADDHLRLPVARAATPAAANCSDIPGATGRDVRRDARRHRRHDPRRRHGHERRRLDVRDLGPDGDASTRSTPVEHRHADDHRHAGATAQTLTADRRHLDRLADDHVHPPVAALRRRGRRVRRDPRAPPTRPTTSPRTTSARRSACASPAPTPAAPWTRRRRQTAVVTAPAVPTPPSASDDPTITGTPREEHTLTADDGTWTGSGPITLTRQWQRCDAAGAGCVDIPGATGATYDLVAADVGSTIRVVVTGDRARRHRRPRRRPATAVITGQAAARARSRRTRRRAVRPRVRDAARRPTTWASSTAGCSRAPSAARSSPASASGA